jgi:hypothetical protein
MDSGILILVSIGSICLGFLVGYIMRGFTRRSKDDKQPKETKPEPLPNTDAKKKHRPKKAPQRNTTEVATLWRNDRDGHLIFQIEDQHYNRGDDLSNREREILLKIVMDFYRWLEPPSQIKTKVEERHQSEIKTTSSQAPMELPNPSASNDLQELKIDASSSQKGLNPANFLSRALRSDISGPTLQTPSMVAQVDEILQEKLLAADMQKWAVRLTEFPDKGMVVLVGLEQYSNIDDVPYERVRKMIRESVAEWERRAEKGKVSHKTK